MAKSKADAEWEKAEAELARLMASLTARQLEELANYEAGSVFLRLSMARMMADGTY